jgi:hypothetical protein
MGLFRRHASQIPHASATPTESNAPVVKSESQSYSLSADELLAGHPDFIEFDVVGESHYQAEIERLVGGRTWDSARMIGLAVLRAEPTNRYDRNAVRVEVAGVLVGHIKRTQAAELSPMILHLGGIVDAVAVITGGWDRGPQDQGLFGAKAWIHVGVAERWHGVAPEEPSGSF